MVMRVVEPGYSARFLRFCLVAWHAEAYSRAYLDQSTASYNELERLRREYVTLPPRHICSCRCPNELQGRPACRSCCILRAQAVNNDLGMVMGHTAAVEAPMPMVLLLDLEMAISAMHSRSPYQLAGYLSGRQAA